MRKFKKILVLLSLISPLLLNFLPIAEAGYQGVQYYNVSENGSITATAPAGAIYTQIVFASYGTPTGSGPYSQGSCHSSSSVSYVSSIFLNKSTAVIYANNTNFGDPCSGTGKSLAIALGYTYSLVNSAVPTISGTTTVAQTLSTSNGSWNYTPNSYSYQWQRSATSGGTYTDVAGATSSSYTLVGTDAGYFFRIKLTATNDAGTSAAVYSSPTAAAVSSAPSTTTLSISGSPTQGTFRSVVPLVINTSVNGKVSVFSNGKVIAGCKNKTTVSLSFTCNWKPTFHGAVVLTSNFVPTSVGYLSSSITPYKIFIKARTSFR